MRSPDIVIRIDRKGLTLVAALVLVGASAGLLWSESLTLVTTYPAPSGIYNQIVTTGNSGTVAADTILNRNDGNTILVPATNGGGKVGIGMTPVYKLDVNGRIGALAAVFSNGVKLGDDAAACTAAKTGTVRWHTGRLQVCDGSAWENANKLAVSNEVACNATRDTTRVCALGVHEACFLVVAGTSEQDGFTCDISGSPGNSWSLRSYNQDDPTNYCSARCLN